MNRRLGLAVAGAMLLLVGVGCQRERSSTPLPLSPPPDQSVTHAPTSAGGADPTDGVAGSAPASASPLTEAAAEPGPVNPGPMPGPCGEMPLLQAYWREGVLEFPNPMVAKLHLVIDLHFADCGAPDGYGHDVELTLALAKSKRGCGISWAASTSKSWGTEPDEPAWRNAWRVQGGPLLTDPDLERIVLRDPAKGQALELGRIGYYFYDKVIPGARLLGRLEDEDDNPKACCFAFTSSRTKSWGWKYGPREK